MEGKIGMLARSKAGHDREKVYVIVDRKENYVYLADGKNRTVDSPKKKKLKHIQLIAGPCGMSELDDAQIRRILKNFHKEEKI